MRRFLVGALSLAIQAAAIGAPLVHAHPEDHATDHHDGPTVHTHWNGHAHRPHPTDEPSLEEPDHDRAIFRNAFTVVTSSGVTPAAVAQATFDLADPVERPSQRGLDTVRSHDPPFLHSLPSRAPPARLS